MNYKLILFALLAFYSCKKEEYSSKYAHYELWDNIRFECAGYQSENMFEGTVDGRRFCMADSPVDTFEWGVGYAFITNEPIANLSPSNKQFYQLNLTFKPKFDILYREPNPFLFQLEYYEPFFDGHTMEEFLDSVFVEKNDLLFSRVNTELLPSLDNVRGWNVIVEAIAQKKPALVTARFCTAYKTSYSNEYIRCTKVNKYVGDDAIIYKIEMEVDVEVWSHRKNTPDDDEPRKRRVKGKFTFQLVI